MSSTDPTLSDAATHHEAGRLAEAEQAYRMFLADHPDDIIATTRLGDVLVDAGRVVEAAAYYRQAIATAPNDPAAAGAYDGMAAVLQDQGHLPAAAAASVRAVELRRDADAAYALGDTLERLDRHSDAVEAFRLAARLRAKFPEAHARLGGALLSLGKLEESVASYEVALTMNPALAEAHCNLANALRRSGETERALLSVKRALELKPELPEAHNVLGVIWRERRRLSDALLEFVRASQLRPDYAEAMNNAGSVLEQLGRFDEATNYFEHAIGIRENEPVFHVNMAHNLLLRGEYPRGWAEHEWRRRIPTNPASRSFKQPQWQGGDLSGQTILLHAEESISDTIQFARYVPLVAERGARVIVECQADVAPIIRRIRGTAEVLVQGQALPEFDVHSPLLTLPLVFGTTVETIPQSMPYITADEQQVSSWSAKLPPRDTAGKSLRVGVVWAGNPRHKDDRARSCPPALLDALGAVDGVGFFSLQKDMDSAALPSLQLVDVTAGLQDFTDLAALTANLDLIIAVDTPVAHLAGAMGKAVWLMVPFQPHWRWLLRREDSPWYPGFRLFRQSIAGDWPGVVERVKAALSERVTASRG